MRRRMKKNLWKSLIIGTFAFLAGSQAVAATLTISFSPSTQMVGVGNSVSVDVLAALGPGEIVSAFDFDLRYDSPFIRTTGVSFTNLLGDPGKQEAITASDLTTPGLTNFAELSLLNDADLAALQSSSGGFKLATISFTAIRSGTSVLEFINYGVGGKDVKGANDVVYSSPTLQTGSIVIGSASPVPEPATFLLLSIGVCCAGLPIHRLLPYRRNKTWISTL